MFKTLLFETPQRPKIVSLNSRPAETFQRFSDMQKQALALGLACPPARWSRPPVTISFLFCEDFDLNKSLDYLSICEYLNNRAKKVILDNPYKSLKYLIRNSLSFSLLNPFHIYSDHIFFSGKLYYQSDLHQDLKIYRVIYSILIYLVCFIGLLHLIKTKNTKLLFFIIISSLYFFSILSWHGNNRYFVPVLIYLSILFGYGANSVLSFFIKSKIN